MIDYIMCPALLIAENGLSIARKRAGEGANWAKRLPINSEGI
ncbi:hypothetical protein [Brevibacillus sp. NRS-1366]